MIHIAIVEDDPKYADDIAAHLRRYGEEHGEDFHVRHYSDGYDIAEHYVAGQDIILMDIEMNLMSGMEAAEKIREADPKVVIVFITNNPHYAIQGYSVQALDYLLKPVTYESFSYMMKKALRALERENGEQYFPVASRDGLIRLRVKDILFVESSSGHRLTVHTAERDYETTASNLREAEEKLSGHGFSRCNNGCLVNLMKVTGMKGGLITIGDTELTVSRGKKAVFMAALADYLV